MAEMKSRQRVASRNPGQPDQPRLRWKTKALLLATAVVIGATIYVVAWDPLKPKTKLPARDTGPTTGERVRQNMEGLIAQADAIDPRGGQGNLVTRQVAYERAAELGKQFVRLADRRDVLVRPVLAMALLRLGRLDEADKTLADLMALAPRSAEGMCLKAEVIEARGGQGALELFRRARATASTHGIETHICGCMNPDLTDERCALAGEWASRDADDAQMALLPEGA